MTRKATIMLFVISLALAVTSFAQDPAPDVSDLVGARAASGETQLKNRGYAFVKSQKGTDRIWSNWWNNRRSQCITVVTMNGRYDSIVRTSELDCDRGGGSNNTTAGAPRDVSDLVGARAAGGETQLKTRGYIFVKSQKGTDRIWANWWNSRREQCITVVTYNGRYDSITGSPEFDCDKDAGNYDKIDLSDLVGMRASSGETQMTNRGFINTNSTKSSTMSYTWWYNSDTDQCVRVTTYNGKFFQIGDSNDSSCHRPGKVDLSDLVGARASSGETQMTNRGFRSVRTTKVGSSSLVYWYKEDSSQCVVISTRDGIYQRINDQPLVVCKR